jgi:hypothetical protein
MEMKRGGQTYNSSMYRRNKRIGESFGVLKKVMDKEFRSRKRKIKIRGKRTNQPRTESIRIANNLLSLCGKAKHTMKLDRKASTINDNKKNT